MYLQSVFSVGVSIKVMQKIIILCTLSHAHYRAMGGHKHVVAHVVAHVLVIGKKQQQTKKCLDTGIQVVHHAHLAP